MKTLIALAAASLLAAPAAAQQADMSAFSTGPVFEHFGPVADVDASFAIPADTAFRHSFDVSTPADGGRLNRGFETAARFINMHARAGVPEERIQVVVVVHGRAVFDLLHDAAWTAAEREGANASGQAVREMLDHGVRFIVCGQSAAAYGVTPDDLIPGVEMALSAMTAHALLQQQGYTVNPF